MGRRVPDSCLMRGRVDGLSGVGGAAVLVMATFWWGEKAP